MRSPPGHLERQLDEDLLELLVDIVDAELLERVALEHLEAVDVQHADHQLPLCLLHLPAE